MKRALALLAVAVWVVSFALPTIDMAGIRGPDLPFALLMATYFPLLALANLVVPLSLVPRLDLGRLRLAVAILASGVPLVPWPELWRVLGLALGERVRLDIGYVVWLLSFWVLVFAAVVDRRSKLPAAVN